MDEMEIVNNIEKNNLVKITPSELFDKLDIMYDKEKDLIMVQSTSDVIISTNNTVMVSKGETIIITGEVLGGKGKLHLNPITLLKKIKNYLLK